MDKWEGTCLNKAWVCQGFWGQVVSRCHSTGESVGHGCNLPGGTLCAKGPREEKNQNLLGNVMNPGLKSSTAVEGMCMQPWLTGWRTWDAWFLPKFWLAKGRQTQLLPRSAQGEGSLADEPHLLPFIKNSIHSMWFSAVRHIRKQVLEKLLRSMLLKISGHLSCFREIFQKCQDDSFLLISIRGS